MNRYTRKKYSVTHKISKCFQILPIVGLLITVCFVIYGVREELFTSSERMTQFLEPLGWTAPFFFILLQMMIVIFPIVPGGVTLLLGVYFFGPAVGFLTSYIGICIGSCVDFYLGKKYGIGLIQKLTSEKTVNKYQYYLSSKYNYHTIFALAIFFPFAPDDLLCYLSGFSKMKFSNFLWIILIGKITSIGIYTFGLKYIADYFLQFF